MSENKRHRLAGISENHKKESHIYLYPQVDVAFFLK